MNIKLLFFCLTLVFIYSCRKTQEMPFDIVGNYHFSWEYIESKYDMDLNGKILPKYRSYWHVNNYFTNFKIKKINNEYYLTSTEGENNTAYNKKFIWNKTDSTNFGDSFKINKNMHRFKRLKAKYIPNKGFEGYAEMDSIITIDAELKFYELRKGYFKMHKVQ